MFLVRRAGPVCGIVAAVHAYNDDSLPIKRFVNQLFEAHSVPLRAVVVKCYDV